MTSLSARIICFSFVLIKATVLFAQSPDTAFYKIQWRAFRNLNVNGKEVKMLSFYTATHSKEDDFLPVFTLPFHKMHLSSAELKEGQWQELAEEEYAYLPNQQLLKSEPDVMVTNGWANRTPNTVCNFIPLRRNVSGKIEKLIKFKLSYVEQTANFPNGNGATTRQALARLQDNSSSVLATGEWYKMAFPSSGVYKIDYAYLQQMGIAPDSVHVNNIQIWGNGGGMLPEPCDSARPQDLNQTPIYISGAEDGKFDRQDYILFYVQGPNIWKKSEGESFYRPWNNFYSSYSYYFLTVGNTNGTRITTSSSSTNAEVTFSSYNYRYVYEKDISNLISTGRKWFGEEFNDVLSQTFSVPTTGIVPGSQVYLESSLVNRSTDANGNYSTFRASVNANTGSVNTWVYSLPGSSTGNDIPIGVLEDFTDSINANSALSNANTLSVNYTYSKSVNGLGTGYLDYFALNFEENLGLRSNPMLFRQLKSINYGVVQYTVNTGNVSEDLRVWDITDLSNISEMEIQKEASSASFTAVPSRIVHEYIAFYGNNFPAPSSQSRISNQNLISSATPDLLIVTHPLFRSQAERLAEFKRKNDGFDVVVANTEEVYNEFSSGSQDLVAIRDFARQFFNRPDGEKLKYLLLVGDASFDYRNILNYPTPTSYVPIYESYESLAPLESYSSDDYVGMLGAGKGDWENASYFLMDIGVGRLPVKSEGEAEAVLNKIMNYASNTATLGTWRQNLVYVADNIEAPEEDAFFLNAESLTSQVESTDPEYNIKKVYVGAYQKVINPNGTTAPGANLDITAALNSNGCFIMNYIGHGSTSQWASENVMNIPMIQSFTNFNQLPFLVTATCDFGKYDSPDVVSGGELFLLEPQGGAIGLLTTTRAVFQTFNEGLNDAFHNNVFLRVNGEHLRLGDIIMNTKNDKYVHSIYTRNFALLGDPSLKLAYPEDTIVITTFNGQPYISGNDTLKAKEKVTITGEIRNSAGQKSQDFNGVVNILIFDKQTTTKTVDYAIDTKKQTYEVFQVLDNKIFDGSATVKNGEFSFTLIIPRDINYQIGLGKISLYANSEENKMIDAGCGETNIYVGSSDTSTISDNTPPQIKLYMNDESFIPGGYTNDHPLLLAKLYDEQGISGIGSTGRSIMGTLSTAGTSSNDNSDLILDSYYKSDRDTYKSGTIRYQMADLKEGNHTIKVKAFDTDTNSATATLDFVVAANNSLSLQHVLNYPNPFTTTTTFHFDHNRPGDELDIMIQIFTVSGKLIKTLSTHAHNAQTHFSDLVWHGKDDYEDEIGRGVYVYKVSVKALSDGSKTDHFEKLVILN